MGIEFNLTKELATISATATELGAIDQLLNQELDAAEFRQAKADLLFDIIDSYRVVITLLQPLVPLLEAPVFATDFAAETARYHEHYQRALSQPRINAENTFQKYLQFRKRPEVKTSYPPLKYSFQRLHDLIDKWIDNDIWLAMCIDSLFKQLNRHLTEVAALNAKDPEWGYLVFQSTVGQLPAFLTVIADAVATLENSTLENTDGPSDTSLQAIN